MKSGQETDVIPNCENVYVIEDDLYEETKRLHSLVVTNGFDKRASASEDDMSPTNDRASPTLMDDEATGQSETLVIRCPLECKNQADSGLESAASSWDRTLADAREQAVSRLQDELKLAHEEIKVKDEQVSRLSRIRNEVEAELEELTASLFQEAHNMVREANMKQAAAEKSLHESLMKVEMLTAEVEALKALVLTSTPSKPNPHLHPQLREDSSDHKKHRRSPSHFSVKNGRDNSPQESPVKTIKKSFDSVDAKETALEVDPIIHKEFLVWKQDPTIEKTDPFIARIYREDIDYCLNFTNEELSHEVRKAIESSDVFIEAVNEKSKNNFPKKCALQDSVRHCHYRLRMGSDPTWHYISHMCRNRIIAVCDFLNYLRYIQRGLVKSSVHDIYWEIVRLRKEMVLARLGLMLTP